MPKQTCRLTFRGLMGTALVLAFSGMTMAWQTPAELPERPRLADETVSEALNITALQGDIKVVIGGEEDGIPAVTLPSQLPAPAIIPVERIIAPSATSESSSRRRITELPAPALPLEAMPSVLLNPDTPNRLDLAAKPAMLFKAMVFKEIEPGKSTLLELRSLWGEPLREQQTEGGLLLTYQVAPFSRVDVNTQDEKVASLTVHFHTPVQLSPLVGQLGLDGFDPVKIGSDAQTSALIYPERGATLVHSGNLADSITSIVLEPLSPKSFLLRVQSDRQHRWQRSLDDLEFAVLLDPHNHHTWWLRSEILFEQGEYRAAAMSIEKALLLQADSPIYQLAAARLIDKAGNRGDAISATATVLKRKNLKPLLKARAELLMGDLLANSPAHDYSEAIEYHQLAKSTVAPLTQSADKIIRHAAKRLLIESHLSIAEDIAQGVWQKKEQIIPQWLDHGQRLAQDLVNNEQGDPTILFNLHCRQIAAYAWLDGKVDATANVSELNKLSETLTKSTSDPTYRRHLAWQLGKAMVDAVDIERARGNHEKAQLYADAAEKSLRGLDSSEWNSQNVQFQLGRLYFLLGSVNAVENNDHTAAVQWYQKSLEYVSHPWPDNDLRRTINRGKWLVSMGISYWNTGDQRRGLRLTKVGASLVEMAHENGATSAESLATPYNNLAFMHEQLGNEEQAKEFAARARKTESAVQR